MVTLQILVLSFLVRIQVAQHEKRKGGTDIVSPFLLYGCGPGSSAPQHMPPCTTAWVRKRPNAAWSAGVRYEKLPQSPPLSESPTGAGPAKCPLHPTPWEQNKARYQKHESAQHGKTRSRQHLPDALVIPYHGKVRNKENEPRPDIGEPLYRNTCGDIAGIQEKSHELFREKHESGRRHRTAHQSSSQ